MTHTIGDVLEIALDLKTEKFKKELAERVKEIARDAFKDWPLPDTLIELNAEIIATRVLARERSRFGWVELSLSAEEKLRILKKWLMEQDPYFVKYAEAEDLN